VIITLLTDFGTADYFVGAMKGVILSINPEARVVDITHEIPPQDVRAGAFTLSIAYRTFPANSIHVAVVDPGVGSARRPILVSMDGHYFVGPDNGLFSYVYEGAQRQRVFHLTNEAFFRQPVSETFHGRDVFAAVAAALSKGASPDEFGAEINDYVRLPALQPQQSDTGTIEAAVIHIDRFGNLITNLTREHLTDEMIGRGLRLIINGREITSLRRFFAEAGKASDELFAIWGSAGYLEIAAFNASAAHLLDARRGQIIIVTGDK
jgi:S-adenosylmethionine hydrolase